MHCSLMVLAMSLLASLNFVAFSFEGVITAALCGTGANLDREQMEDAVKKGAELSQKIAEEGITLLKNEDTLPLKPVGDDAKVKLNVFGKSSSDECFVYQGYGSGGGSREPSTRIPLYQALRGADIEINENLANSYNAMTPVRNQAITADDKNIYEAPKEFYTDALMESAKGFSNNALVVISRTLGEAYDAPMYQSVNGKTTESRHFLQLCEEEEYMLQKVTNTFDNVIVLLNSTNVMEVGFLEDEKIDAALTIYAPGHAGTMAVGNVLTGAVNPSGRTVDTWAYSFETNATFVNAGVNGSHQFGNMSDYVGYVDYAENIYQGYYWYETADVEHYWDDVKNAYGEGYDGVVQYPFGYGLSYTDFEWTISDISIPEGSALDADSEIVFKVQVENIGDVAGKDVVELYATPEYFEGGIEKSAVKLVAFDKTPELKPGEICELELKTTLFDMASYDVYDKNNNGFMGYEAERGNYTLSLRKNAHEVNRVRRTFGASLTDGNFDFKVEEDGGIRFENDPVTGNPIKNRFTTYSNTTSGASSTYVEAALSKDSKAFSVDGTDAGCNINYMTRADFKNTFPTVTPVRNMSDELKTKSYNISAPVINEDDVMPVTNSTETNWTIYDLLDADYEDERWMQMVQQLSKNELAGLCMDGGWGTHEIKSIMKPYCSHSDGPSGFNRAIASLDTGYATNFPCATLIASTWNWRMAYQFGMAVGDEGKAGDIQGWYGPACDIHRSPFSGRNFEYYSEDPVISGIMVAMTAKGAIEKGLYPFVKHFVVADTEPFRNGKYTWLTEQALREIYLKPFEYAVKVGETTGMMTAYNRVGSIRCSGSYALNTEVLRNEWGFEGCVISDYYAADHHSMDEDEFIRAGNDLKLLPGGKVSDLDDLNSATAVIALQKSAKNILYSYCHTIYVHSTATGLDMNTLVGTKSAVFPWWEIILGAIDAAAVAGCGIGAYFVIRKTRKPDPTEE